MLLRIRRNLNRIIIVKWYFSLFFLIKKVRVNPSVLFVGKIKTFLFDPGVKVSKNCCFETSSDGIIHIQDNVWLSHGIYIQTSETVTIVKNTTIQRYTTINGDVKISDGCIIAPNVFMSSGIHPFREYKGKTIRDQEQIIISDRGSLKSLSKSIVVGNDCWLGINVVICPGVSIGDGCVIGANSVVTRSVSEYSIVAGSPARVIGSR